MTMQVNGTSGFTFPDNTTQATAAKVGMVNRIINGAMMIDQRNAGASVTITSQSFAYIVDRFTCGKDTTGSGSVTAQQSTNAPSGFRNSFSFTVGTAFTPSSSEGLLIQQRIEGFNTADFGFGAAGASTVTLSFWVRSSVTGTFSGSLVNGAFNRSYPYTYTITAANTWEQKTVTIAGDTSGTWVTDNGIGLRVYWDLGSGSSLRGTAGAWTGSGLLGATGSVSLAGTAGATFYITGVQLEKGSTATSFDYRPYGTELQLCQRYYQKISGSINGGPYQQFAIITYESATTAWGVVPLRVTMRSQPTTTYSGSFSVNYGTQGTLINDTNQTGGDLGAIGWTTGSGGSVPAAAYIRANNSTATFISFSAEL